MNKIDRCVLCMHRNCPPTFSVHPLHSTPMQITTPKPWRIKKIRMRIRFLLEGEKPRFFAISLSREKNKSSDIMWINLPCFCCFAVPWMACPPRLIWQRKTSEKSRAGRESSMRPKRDTIQTIFAAASGAVVCPWRRNRCMPRRRRTWSRLKCGGSACPYPTGTWDHQIPRQICKTNKACLWGILPHGGQSDRSQDSQQTFSLSFPTKVATSDPAAPVSG